MKLKRLFLALSLLASQHLSIFSQVQNNTDQTGEEISELKSVFGILTQNVLMKTPLPYFRLREVNIDMNNNKLVWHGEYLESDYIMVTRSRDVMKNLYGDYLGNLYRKFLEDAGWNVETVNSDHMGEYQYRVLYRAEKEKDLVCFVYEATDLGDGDWDEQISFLSEPVAIIEDKECDYNSFFEEVLAITIGSADTISRNPCFKFSIYNKPESIDLGGKIFFKKLSFYCQFGSSSTMNGYSCYDLMFTYFMDFLDEKGYSVKLTTDASMTGWIKKLFQATGKDHSFRFVWESESAGSMGYSKIAILMD